MPRASKTSASENVELDGYEGHIENFEGGYTVAFETYTADADLAPLFAGLPGDRCQCAHWGYVVKGKITFKTETGDETFEAGDAYYVGPGHTPVLSDRNQNWFIHEWLMDHTASKEWSVLHARPRDEPEAKKPSPVRLVALGRR